MFHRDAGYLEGRRVRRSREMRAMATRTAFGRELIAGQWAVAEFAVLGRLWTAGRGGALPGAADRHRADDGVHRRPTTVSPHRGWRSSDPTGARHARCTHSCATCCARSPRPATPTATCRPYNILVHDGRLVLIDLPQAVDLVGNPQGFDYLRRDCVNICSWFAARGVPEADARRSVATSCCASCPA